MADAASLYYETDKVKKANFQVSEIAWQVTTCNGYIFPRLVYY
jgi:hypothetical protein